MNVGGGVSERVECTGFSATPSFLPSRVRSSLPLSPPPAISRYALAAIASKSRIQLPSPINRRRVHDLPLLASLSLSAAVVAVSAARPRCLDLSERREMYKLFPRIRTSSPSILPLALSLRSTLHRCSEEALALALIAVSVNERRFPASPPRNGRTAAV